VDETQGVQKRSVVDTGLWLAGSQAQGVRNSRPISTFHGTDSPQGNRDRWRWACGLPWWRGSSLSFAMTARPAVHSLGLRMAAMCDQDDGQSCTNTILCPDVATDPRRREALDPRLGVGTRPHGSKSFCE
jgi:hypothetical protein